MKQQASLPLTTKKAAESEFQQPVNYHARLRIAQPEEHVGTANGHRHRVLVANHHHRPAHGRPGGRRLNVGRFLQNVVDARRRLGKDHVGALLRNANVGV
jgi:hypothetical protein